MIHNFKGRKIEIFTSSITHRVEEQKKKEREFFVIVVPIGFLIY